MKKVLLILTINFFILFFSSCSFKDHNIQSNDCKYIGQTWIIESKNSSYISKYTYDSNIDLEDSGFPRQMNSIYTTFTGDSAKLVINSSEQKNYSYKYDKDGFLLQTRFSKLYHQNTGGFSYNNSPTLTNAKIEQIETTEYQYESNLLKTAITKDVTTVTSDNADPTISSVISTKSYNYDANGITQMAKEVFDNGGTATTYFVDGLISSLIRNNADGSTISTTNYNKQGRPILYKIQGTEYISAYDQNDNLTSVKMMYDGKLVNQYDFNYDNQPNPETLIPMHFKGIPIPMRNLYTSDGNNNLVRSKFTNYQNNYTSEEVINYTYNSSGLPQSSALNNMSASRDSKLTTYKYKDCQ